MTANIRTLSAVRAFTQSLQLSMREARDIWYISAPFLVFYALCEGLVAGTSLANQVVFYILLPILGLIGFTFTGTAIYHYLTQKYDDTVTTTVTSLHWKSIYTWRTTHTKFLIWNVLIQFFLLSGVIFFGLITMMFQAIAGQIAVFFITLAMGPALLALLWVVSRLLLIFPAIALGHYNNVTTYWQLGAPVQWFLLRLWLVWILSLILMVVGSSLLLTVVRSIGGDFVENSIFFNTLFSLFTAITYTVLYTSVSRIVLLVYINLMHPNTYKWNASNFLLRSDL